MTNSFPFFQLARRWDLPYDAVICAVEGSWKADPGVWGHRGYNEIWKRLNDQQWAIFRTELSYAIQYERDRRRQVERAAGIPHSLTVTDLARARESLKPKTLNA